MESVGQLFSSFFKDFVALSKAVRQEAERNEDNKGLRFELVRVV